MTQPEQNKEQKPGAALAMPLIVLNCIIRHFIIGPHVAIGANTNIQQSVVRESMIGFYTALSEVVIDNSLIGSDASVKGLSRSLNIGDNTEIEFG